MKNIEFKKQNKKDLSYYKTMIENKDYVNQAINVIAERFSHEKIIVDHIQNSFDQNIIEVKK